MNAAKGKSMQRCMFVKQRLMQNFPTWNRYNLVKLAITWLEKVTKLHQRDILIGDINPNNFLIVSDTEVYFVDTDSYQIKDYVCPVGMANFTAPEIQNSDFTSFYRTPQHEYFAIATLLFMILLPGKPPFSHQGGGDPRENIRERAFPYPLGEISGQAAPPGPWRFIWSHLPFKTKEAFYNCFTKDIRISADEWLELMRSYKHALEVGYLSSSGGSHDLFPAVFKELSEHAKIKYGKTEKSGSANNYPEIGMNFRTSRNSQPGNPRGNKKQKHGPLSVFQIYSDLYNFKSNNSTEGD